MRRWLLLFALVTVVGHHVGTIIGPLGDVGGSGTRWADWVDLVVPYLVVGSAALALAAGITDRFGWSIFGLAAVAYTQGHGIHLAANSINNAVGGHVAHLWDEVVGHYIWYAGLTGIVVVLVRAASPLAGSWPAYVAAVLFGFMWFTNSIEGGVAVFGLVIAVAMTAYAAVLRVPPAVAAYAVALGLMAVWGVWQGGFPQFSQLGWI